MFPALPILFSDKMRFPMEINAFEPGVWMFPILISNAIIFATIILYRKNKLPQMLTSLFRFILNFEISHRTALVFVGVLIASYAILTAGEVYTDEEWGDFEGVERTLQNWSFDDVSFENLRSIAYFFGYWSMEIFGSYKVSPFIASIVSLVLTYLILCLFC